MCSNSQLRDKVVLWSGLESLAKAASFQRPVGFPGATDFEPVHKETSYLKQTQEEVMGLNDRGSGLCC